MAGQSGNNGLIAQAIGQYFTYRLLVIPAVALLMVMTAYVALRGNRAYVSRANDNQINIGQESMATETRRSGGFALDGLDASQGNDDGLESAGTQGGYSNVTAMTASYVDWGAEDNSILSAFLGHLKKTLPEDRGLSAAGPVVAGASEA